MELVHVFDPALVVMVDLLLQFLHLVLVGVKFRVEILFHFQNLLVHYVFVLGDQHHFILLAPRRFLRLFHMLVNLALQTSDLVLQAGQLLSVPLPGLLRLILDRLNYLVLVAHPAGVLSGQFLSGLFMLCCLFI